MEQWNQLKRLFFVSRDTDFMDDNLYRIDPFNLYQGDFKLKYVVFEFFLSIEFWWDVSMLTVLHSWLLTPRRFWVVDPMPVVLYSLNVTQISAHQVDTTLLDVPLSFT